MSTLILANSDENTKQKSNHSLDVVEAEGSEKALPEAKQDPDIETSVAEPVNQPAEREETIDQLELELANESVQPEPSSDTTEVELQPDIVTAFHNHEEWP